MLERHHSLSAKVIALVLAQNGVLAALLFYIADDATPLEMLAIAALLIVMTLVTMLLAQRMVQPLKALAAMATGLAAGKPAIGPEYLLRADEIGHISRQMETLSRAYITQVIEEQEEREERQNRAEAAHARDMKAARDEAFALRTIVETLDGAVRRLAVGDLTVRLDMPFAGEFEGLRADFNHALTILEESFDRINEGTHILHTACTETRDGIAEAALGGTRQSAAAAKAASDINRLAEALRARKMQTEYAANIGHNARADMRRPKDAMQAAAAAMEAIRKSALDVEPATGAIQEIAFQASMLALTAGMDAAQLGEEQGRFTAVAQEIRGLAERAAEAAREIATLSRKSAEAAELGGRSLEKADGELDAMMLYMNALKGHADAIAAGSGKETEAVAAVGTALGALAEASRDQSVRLDALTAKVGRMGREIGAIDHHAGRFTPVTVLVAGGTSIPEISKPPKPGGHLRLVKG